MAQEQVRINVYDMVRINLNKYFKGNNRLIIIELIIKS